MEDQKNLIWAMVLSGIVLLLYVTFIGQPAEEAMQREQAQQAEIEAAPEPEPLRDRTEVINEARATGGRISIDTPSLTGSLSLDGLRVDDVTLKNYDRTLDAADGKVTLLSPEGTEHAAFVSDNWVARDGGSGLDNGWSLVSGETLTPSTPITVQYVGDGFTVDRTISVDDRYLLTMDDVVTNTSEGEIELVRKGAARQYGLPQDLTNFFILHEGPASVVGGDRKKAKYKKTAKDGPITYSGSSGWSALTDKYWLIAAIAPQDQTMTSTFQMQNYAGQDVYTSEYAMTPVILRAGQSMESKGYMYVGAKRVKILKEYSEQYGIEKLDFAVDWGNILWPLTRPLTFLISYFGNMVGNFGVGIIIVTFIMKALLFPLNNKAYSSMAKMKKFQPQIKKLQTLYKDDPMAMRTKMMELYKKEGVNPMGGCLPMIPQIFIFFALYKSIFINVDLRQQPFFGYIEDLSAREPISILNGFGLLPWDAVPFGFLAFFAIGPMALLYGVTMAMTQTLSPSSMTDPMQKRIFQLMPWLFMFILAPFAAGLLVYWVTSNILTFIQQYIITRRHNVETPFDRFFNRILGKPNKAENS